MLSNYRLWHFNTIVPRRFLEKINKFLIGILLKHNTNICFYMFFQTILKISACIKWHGSNLHLNRFSEKNRKKIYNYVFSYIFVH
ncbi:hypothetical protein C0V77_18870 [Emticicia sp. TH156]|nr:hypothetical protein C0V77_18870 [Emticicia sp. TH156]